MQKKWQNRIYTAQYREEAMSKRVGRAKTLLGAK